MELCKTCIFFDPNRLTCAKTTVAITRGRRIQHGYAKMAREDPKQCGPSARFFFPRPSRLLVDDPLLLGITTRLGDEEE